MLGWLKRVWPFGGAGDPHVGRWGRRRDSTILAGAFGRGSRKPFGWYLEGESSVRVHSVDEVCSWLEGCDYVGDRELLGVEDHWCHPVDFERRRRGDCEDHALWAWRKLHELGVVATLVAGEARSDTHVWVTFVEGDVLYLLESTRKQERLVFPAGEVDHYWPAYGVDTRLRTYRYDALRSAPGSRPNGDSVGT